MGPGRKTRWVTGKAPVAPGALCAPAGGWHMQQGERRQGWGLRGCRGPSQGKQLSQLGTLAPLTW